MYQKSIEKNWLKNKTHPKFVEPVVWILVCLLKQTHPEEGDYIC